MSLISSELLILYYLLNTAINQFLYLLNKLIRSSDIDINAALLKNFGMIKVYCADEPLPTLTYRCLGICLSSSLLQLALFDLK